AHATSTNPYGYSSRIDHIGCARNGCVRNVPSDAPSEGESMKSLAATHPRPDPAVTPRPAAPDALAQERDVVARASRPLLGFLSLPFVVSFLDRINIGFAGLTMTKDLGLSGTQFGLATTLFYLAYIACGIPSNMALARVGARRWIAVLMVSWGLASTATMFATT